MKEKEVKELILAYYSDIAKLLLMSETEIRQYLYERYEDAKVLAYSKIELDAAITGVIDGRLFIIEHLIDMLMKGKDGKHER